MHKKIIFVMCMFLILIFGGVSYAAENPFNGLTQDQVIQKYFDGRQLDSIEGVWLNDDAKPIIIIKANLIGAKNDDNYDYFIVEYSSSPNADIIGVHKTQHPSCFERGRAKILIRFVSQTTLQINETSYYNWSIYRFYTRIYPNEIK